ncbi:MAG: L,D-transpeptidase [Rubellimicrobium sp.]|nr:L,D-transpeptidase [Rubellimicrobium sp.]
MIIFSSSCWRPARVILALAALAFVAACARRPEPVEEPEVLIGGIPVSQIVEGYGLIEDGGFTLPPVPPRYLAEPNRRAFMVYPGNQPPGTIEIDPYAKFLYWIMEDGMAMRYPIAVGRDGLGLNFTTTIRRKAEWPGWTPTANMLRREPEVYGPFRNGVPGGLASPMGARALYLYRNGRDTFFRIHGTNDLGSIGNSGSAGCIRLFNHDMIDLYDRIPIGTRVVMRSFDESVRIEGWETANRGVELPPVILTPDELFGRAEQQMAGVVPSPEDLGVPLFDTSPEIWR